MSGRDRPLYYTLTLIAMTGHQTGVCEAFNSHQVFFFVSLEMSLFQSTFVPLPFCLCMESTSYGFPFRVISFYLVTTGWIFDITNVKIQLVIKILLGCFSVLVHTDPPCLACLFVSICAELRMLTLPAYLRQNECILFLKVHRLKLCTKR